MPFKRTSFSLAEIRSCEAYHPLASDFIAKAAEQVMARQPDALIRVYSEVSGRVYVPQSSRFEGCSQFAFTVELPVYHRGIFPTSLSVCIDHVALPNTYREDPSLPGSDYPTKGHGVLLYGIKSPADDQTPIWRLAAARFDLSDKTLTRIKVGRKDRFSWHKATLGQQLDVGIENFIASAHGEKLHTEDNAAYEPGSGY